jgi:hypothetical protein
MSATFTIPLITTIPGQTITASLWNNEFENIDTNFIPAGMDDYSATDAEMQNQTDPYPASATSRPTSLQGELERIRYVIGQVSGRTYWYQDPITTIAALYARFPIQSADIGGDQVTATHIANNAVITTKILDSNVTTAKIADLNVTTAKIADSNVTTAKIASAAVDENKIASSVAGNGLAGGAGTALSVNVDASTIEINADTLRIKDAGVTEAKLATAVVNKLGQNIGLTTIVSSSSNATLVSYSGQGRLTMIAAEGGTVNAFTVTIDGVAITGPTLTINQIMVFSGASPYVAGSSTAGVTPASFLFKTSLVVAKSAGFGSLVIIYERAA